MNTHSAEMSAEVSPLVLLVDRDIDTLRMYTEHLTRSSSFSTDEASDGREALAKALARPPAAVVTETRLPGLDGYQLIDLLRRDPATSAVPVVVLTGDAFPYDLDRAARSGADAVLLKPCLPDRLVTELYRVTERSHEILGHARRDCLSSISTTAGIAARRTAASRAFERHLTRTPPHPPPAIICPQCDRPLVYVRSFIGGVSERFAEQWDDLECAGGCGVFQYRQRTRKLRQVS
jgi:two-component system, cell cycle response regulator DivK